MSRPGRRRRGRGAIGTSRPVDIVVIRREWGFKFPIRAGRRKDSASGGSAEAGRLI